MEALGVLATYASLVQFLRTSREILQEPSSVHLLASLLDDSKKLVATFEAVTSLLTDSVGDGFRPIAGEARAMLGSLLTIITDELKLRNVPWWKHPAVAIQYLAKRKEREEVVARLSSLEARLGNCLL